jgi:hypothetical protein
LEFAHSADRRIFKDSRSDPCADHFKNCFAEFITIFVKFSKEETLADGFESLENFARGCDLGLARSAFAASLESATLMMSASMLLMRTKNTT